MRVHCIVKIQQASAPQRTLRQLERLQAANVGALRGQPEEGRKRCLDLLPDEDVEAVSAATNGAGEGPVSGRHTGLDSSFGGMLQGLMYARAAAQDARSLGTSPAQPMPVIVSIAHRPGAMHELLALN